MIPTFDADLEDPVTGDPVRIEAATLRELDQRVEAFYTTAMPAKADHSAPRDHVGTSPTSTAVANSLRELLLRHDEQLFGRLAAFAAQHQLAIVEVADLIGQGSDLAIRWARWAATGPACTCTRAFGGDHPAVRHFDCLAHGDSRHRDANRIRLAAP